MRCVWAHARLVRYGERLGERSEHLSQDRLRGVGFRELSAVLGWLVSVARRDAQVATSAAVGGVVYTPPRACGSFDEGSVPGTPPAAGDRSCVSICSCLHAPTGLWALTRRRDGMPNPCAHTHDRALRRDAACVGGLAVGSVWAHARLCALRRPTERNSSLEDRLRGCWGPGALCGAWAVSIGSTSRCAGGDQRCVGGVAYITRVHVVLIR